MAVCISTTSDCILLAPSCIKACKMDGSPHRVNTVMVPGAAENLILSCNKNTWYANMSDHKKEMEEMKYEYSKHMGN